MSRSSLGLLVGALAALPVVSLAHASIVSANFAGYSDGLLVGQNGWQQYGSATARPLSVAGGTVSWTGGNTTDGQDAMLAFPAQITQPLEGETILNFDLLLTVNSAGANPSYFAALNTLTTTGTSGNFANARMVAKSSGAGFVFGTRVNGQGGYPFAYGATELAFGTRYALRAEIHMVAGNANDYINLYVGSDFDSLSLYATAAYGSGSVSDPLFGAMLLSQFGSGTTFESGLSVERMSVALVPAPAGLAAFGLLGLAGGRRRR